MIDFSRKESNHLEQITKIEGVLIRKLPSTKEGSPEYFKIKRDLDVIHREQASAFTSYLLLKSLDQRVLLRKLRDNGNYHWAKKVYDSLVEYHSGKNPQILQDVEKCGYLN